MSSPSDGHHGPFYFRPEDLAQLLLQALSNIEAFAFASLRAQAEVLSFLLEREGLEEERVDAILEEFTTAMADLVRERQGDVLRRYAGDAALSASMREQVEEALRRNVSGPPGRPSPDDRG